MAEIRTETMTVNMGPQHPSTHGVLRLVLELDGETIVSAAPTIGYLHTGIEKTAEQKKFQQVDSAGRAHGLSERAVQRVRLLPVGREAARARDARSREVDPRAARRAAAHQQPSRLARHARHGNRRGVGDAVLLPRAGAAARHQRAHRGLPVVPELHPRRRPARGSAAGLPRGRHAVPRELSRQARRVRGPAHQERHLPQAYAGRRQALEAGLHRAAA